MTSPTRGDAGRARRHRRGAPPRPPERLKLALLLESLQYDTDVRDEAASRDLAVRLIGLREAVAAALA